MKIKKTLHIHHELLQEFARNSNIVIWGADRMEENYITISLNIPMPGYCFFATTTQKSRNAAASP